MYTSISPSVKKKWKILPKQQLNFCFHDICDFCKIFFKHLERDRGRGHVNSERCTCIRRKRLHYVNYNVHLTVDLLRIYRVRKRDFGSIRIFLLLYTKLLKRIGMSAYDTWLQVWVTIFRLAHTFVTGIKIPLFCYPELYCWKIGRRFFYQMDENWPVFMRLKWWNGKGRIGVKGCLRKIVAWIPIGKGF